MGRAIIQYCSESEGPHVVEQFTQSLCGHFRRRIVYQYHSYTIRRSELKLRVISTQEASPEQNNLRQPYHLCSIWLHDRTKILLISEQYAHSTVVLTIFVTHCRVTEVRFSSELGVERNGL